MTRVEFVTAGHSLQIVGLPGLLRELQEWPELRRITVGKVQGHFGGGRGGAGNGKRKSIALKASGYSKVGGGRGGNEEKIVGIACRASTASAQQNLLLLPVDDGDGKPLIGPLLERLVRERCCTWSDVERW